MYEFVDMQTVNNREFSIMSVKVTELCIGGFFKLDRMLLISLSINVVVVTYVVYN